MKCPKCGYIGFESSERCKNCGYDFSLAVQSAPGAELPLRPSEPMGPLADLSLDGAGQPAAAQGKSPPADRLDLDRLIGAPRKPKEELPLFRGEAARDDLSLIRPSPARPPLSVRRATPPAPHLRPRALRLEPMDLELGLEAAEAPAARALEAGAATEVPERAGAVARLVAGLADAVIVGALDVAVLYFTLRLCRLAPSEIFLLPPLPLLAFFVLLNGGYFVAFTVAGGQTIGKMATGIRVVDSTAATVPLGRAIVRTFGYVASAIPLGLGFVPALVGRTRRGLHDWLAGTRVVKV